MERQIMLVQPDKRNNRGETWSVFGATGGASNPGKVVSGPILEKVMTEWSLKGGIRASQVNQTQMEGEGVPGSRNSVIDGREARSRKCKQSTCCAINQG